MTFTASIPFSQFKCHPVSFLYMAVQASVVAKVIIACAVISNEAVKPTYIKKFDNTNMLSIHYIVS